MSIETLRCYLEDMTLNERLALDPGQLELVEAIETVVNEYDDDRIERLEDALDLARNWVDSMPAGPQDDELTCSILAGCGRSLLVVLGVRS